jgi:hypothetical protein
MKKRRKIWDYTGLSPFADFIIPQLQPDAGIVFQIREEMEAIMR